jgi:hypothetical protein
MSVEQDRTTELGNQALREALLIIGGVDGYRLEMAEQRISRAIEILGGSRQELFSNAEKYLSELQQKEPA